MPTLNTRPRAGIMKNSTVIIPALGRVLRAGIMGLIPALGRVLWLHPNLKSEFQGYNVKMTRRSQAYGKNARPRVPPAAFGLP